MTRLEEVKANYKNYRKNKEKDKKANTTQNSKLERAKQYYRAKEIGLDTFESDLTSLSKSISKAYSGWQTQETMENTLSSVQGMYERLGKYQEYQKQYGGADLSDLQKSYKSIIDNWGTLSEQYGGYKDKKAYDKVMKNISDMATYDSKTGKKKISTLEGYLKTAGEYKSEIGNLESLQKTAEARSYGGVKGINQDKIDAKSKEYKDFLKTTGYSSYEEIEKALGNEKVFRNNAIRYQEKMKLGSVGDINSEYYDPDYNKYVTKGKSINPEDVGTSEVSYRVRNRNSKKTIVKSDDRRAAEALSAFLKGEKTQDDGYYDKDVIFALMTEKEFNDVAYYLAKDQEDGGNRTSQYVESIKEILNARRGEEIADMVDGTWRQGAFAITSGLDQFVTGWTNNFSDKDYIPTNQIQFASGEIREDIYEDNGWLARTGYDLLNTGANMLPSILMSTASNALLPGSGAVIGASAMGMSASGNAYQEMLNLGYDKGQARAYSVLVGVSEGGLQYALGGIGKLGGVSGKVAKAVQGIDNGIAKFAIRWGSSALAEGFEEAAQEVLNPLFMNIAAGYDTGEEIDWSEVAYSGLLGALSGGLMEGPGLAVNTYAEHSNNKNIGQAIKDNGKVGDVFDLAMNSPETSLAYEAYTRYANKGINAENIKDAQLGSLWQNARADKEGIAHNKNTPTNEVLMAKEDYANLGDMAKYNPEARVKSEIAKKTYKDTENVEALIDSGLESEENTESHRLATELKAKLDNGKKITTEEINALIKANDEAISKEEETTSKLEEYVAGMDEEEAKIFRQHYDGKTDIDEYAISFNLVAEYSKHPDSFSADHILQNKGVLPTKAATELYTLVTKKVEDEASAKTNAEVLARARKGERGIIDESAINYGKEFVSGKVHWESLGNREKQAVIFAKGLYKALGSNLSFVGKNKEFNGMYNIGKDMTYIDVYAGKSTKDWTGKDFIITTIAHELTHEMEVKSPEAFKMLADIVLDSLEKSPDFKGKTRNDIIADEIARLDEAHPEEGKHTDADAISEIVARACEDLLAESKEAKAMFKSLSPAEQKTLAEKIKDLIQKVLDWIDEFLASYKHQSKSAEAKALREMKETFEAMSILWDNMLRDVQKYNQALENNSTKESNSNEDASSDGGMKFAIREEFSSEIDAWKKDGMPNGETFILGTTGDVLQGLGAIESDIYMLGDKINEIIKKHPEMSIEEIKKIPQILENPVLILKSQNIKGKGNSNTRLVIYGNVKAQDGKPILSVLDLRPVEKNLVVDDMQKVSSAYTKDTNPIDFVKNSLVVYADKKRTIKLLRSMGFYAPIELQQNGYIGSISYVGRSVNINGENFSKVFKITSNTDSTSRQLSEGQIEYFKDSTVRDENGNLKVMYRGDSSEFTVFDRKKTSHSNLYGRGFYFTDSKSHAEQYGSSREFYLDIKNPLSPKQNVITKKQMLDFLKAIENDGEDYDLYNYGQGATAESVLNSVWGKGDFEMLQDISAGAIGDLVAAVELFNEVNGTNYDGIVLPTETVTFNSEQAKLTSNLNPTKDKDMRFQMRENVEETKDLVAVHNLSSEKLSRTLKLGGLPMPSIAITRAREGYNNFGAISLVFGKETIDPKFFRSNKVYSGDAWTPTYPQIAYKLNTKEQEQIKKKIDELVPSKVRDDLGGLHLDSSNMEYELNRSGDMVQSYRYNYAMKYAFLKDKGIDIELPTKDEPLYRYGEVSNEAVISFAHKMVDGLKTVNSLLEQHSSKLMEDTELINGIASVLNEEVLSTVEENTEAYQKMVEEPLFKPEDINLSTVLGMLEASRKYFHTNGKIESKVDYREARNLIDEKVDMAKYESWLKDLFSDVIAKEGIRNNKDLYTPSGNRRSFEALHYEHTLENVIKAMKEQGEKGIGGFGGRNIFGASTNEYSSIKDIKSDAENRMQQLPESQYNEIKKGFTDRFLELASSLPIHKDSFSAIDDAANMLIEAVSKFKTKSGMANYLRTESKGWANYSDYIVDDLVELVNDIRNMPVAYFEAKPQRAVGYDEIRAVIMPTQESYEDDLSEVKSELEKIGVPILEYEYGDNNSRLKALNSLEGLKFSDRETQTDNNVFTDIEGKERNILKHNELGYHILGTRKYNSYFPTAQEAIEAENENIKSYYAKKLSVKKSYIDKMVKNDEQFIVKLALKDIHYSDREDTNVYDLMGERDRLLKENEKWRSDVERLKERLALERKITKGNYFNENQLNAVAGHLRKIANSNMDKVELMKALKDVYSFIAHNEHLTWEDVFERSYRVAEDILADAKPQKVVDDYSKGILNVIRNTRISLSEEQKKEAQNRFGKNWNRYFFNRANITNNGTPIDIQWQEWASQYPDVFSSETNPMDMLEELYDTIGSLQEASETIMEYNNEEITRWLAGEVYNQYWNVSPIRTTADKYDKQIKLLNFKHRQTMKEARDAYESRLADQKKADRAKYTKLANEIRERKDRDVARAKELGKKRLESFKENAERKTVIQSMTSTAMSLNKKLTTNSKDIHIPDTLKPVVINLINAIDFSSKQLLGMSGTKKEFRGTPSKSDISTENSLSKVHSMESGKADTVSLKRAITDALELFEQAGKVLDGTSDGLVDSSVAALDKDMVDSIKQMIKDLDILIDKGEMTFVLQNMSTDHLKTLNGMVKSINHWAIVADKALANKHKKRISDLGMQTVEETDVLGSRQEYIKKIESIKNYFNWSNLLPVNAFKRLGDGATELFDGLRDSQDKVTFNRQEVMDFTAELFKKYKKYKPMNWRTDVKTFDIKLPGENKTTKVSMPVSYIMSLYAVAKQEDAQRHLYGKDATGNKLTYTDEKGNVHDGGGMTIKGFKEGKFTLKVNKSLDNTVVNEEIVKQITSVLTKEQIEVADALQKYMNEKGSEWGDAVSMALYGIKKFGVENYFPITVSPHTLNSDKVRDKIASLFSILNYGFTKERNPNAKQSIEIGDIFDVFANHMNMVAIYNAYALSVFDIARWYNFKGKTDKGAEISVTKSIEKAFGEGATTYVSNLIKDLNGQHESSRLGFISKIFKNTKVAMVGNSLSVALLQPTAYLKAMVKMPPKYLLKSALYIKDFGAKKGVEKAKKYCGIALLKSQGYFETGVSSNTTTKMLHDESWGEKFTEWSLKSAGWMDERTWGVLWNACEFEVRATRKDLKVGSEEFYKVIADKLRDVIYETQVVDSPLTKSDLMRSSDTGAKMVTMFASEITVAYNMVFEAAYDTMLDSKRYGKKEAIKKNRKNIMMTLTAYTLTSAANALLTTAVESFRYGDDDDDENKLLKNFLEDWVIIGKIPYLKELLGFSQGFSSSRTDTLWLESAFKAYEYWGKAIEGKDGATMKAIDETLKSISYVSGIAVYNQWRDLRALLRKIGVMEED